MPQAKRMGLTILSGNQNNYNMVALKSNTQNNSTPSLTPSLSGPMIGRIHFAKPGCSSCGRH
jgi:hypothetical protein